MNCPEPEQWPYAAAVAAWGPLGWAVLPLPRGQKWEPPRGFTGRSGGTPTPQQMQQWLEHNSDGNAALRPPRGVLGLDVDAYDGKRGRLTWAEHCQALGEPPPTWWITSRTDGVSGIRLFRHKAGGPYRSHLAGGDVDLIHFGHRYAVLPPSIHPEGRRYRLLDPDGVEATVVPRPEDLPALPSSWSAALQPAPARGRKRTLAVGLLKPREGAPPQQVDDELVRQARSLISTRQAKALRDRRGLTLREVAERLNMRQSRVRHMEEGRLRSPRPHQLAAYARLLLKE